MNTTMNTIEDIVTTNTVVADLISTFSKTNKIGKSKVQSLVIECLSTVPVGKAKGGKTGRPLSEDGKQIRDFIIKSAANGGVTSGEVAKKFGIKTVQVNSHLRRLEKDGKIVRYDEPVKSGKVGKPSILWVAPVAEAEETQEA